MSGTKPVRKRGYTRLSGKRQVTIPLATVAAVGLEPGDELRVDVDDRGRIVLTPGVTLGARRRAAIEAGAGKFSGLYPAGSLDRLRDEWR